MAKKKTNSKLNLIVSCIVALGALVFFSRAFEKQPDAGSGTEPQSPAVNTARTAPQNPAAPEASQPAPAGKGVVLRGTAKNPPPGLPPDMVKALQNPPPEIPEDLKKQLAQPPPELPEDLKRQLQAPPPELPPDLKAQLEAPPPELPEDIKRAMQVPPRTVSIDEVNTPPDPGM